MVSTVRFLGDVFLGSPECPTRHHMKTRERSVARIGGASG